VGKFGTCALLLDVALAAGDDFAFVIPAAMDSVEVQRVLSYARPSGGHPKASAWAGVAPSVSRTAIVHLRALQALDGVRAGASHRLVANVLFGADAVARRWTPDGDLRAQIRYLIHRGQALSYGGYRSLLSQPR